MNEESTTPEALDEEIRRNLFCPPDEIAAEAFPELGFVSARHLFTALPIPTRDSPPTEYVRVQPKWAEGTREWVELRHFCAIWNFVWEAGELRQVGMPKEFSIPEELAWIKGRRGKNFSLVFGSGYEEYAPLYHLLPARHLQAAGLPLLRRGLWQPAGDFRSRWLPPNLISRLSKAVGSLERVPNPRTCET